MTSNLRLRYIIIFLSSVLILVTNAYSVFDCGCCPNWEVTTADNVHMAHRYLNWLAMRHNQCENNRGFLNLNKYSFGYGSSINLSCVEILKALELGAVYRPIYPWLWSSPDIANSSATGSEGFPKVNDGCYSKIDSLDCFNIPLSYCKLDQNYNLSPGAFGEPAIDKEDALDLIPQPCDICTQAKRTKKTLLWIFGMILHYHMRLPPRTHKIVHDRLVSIFPPPSSIAPVDPITGKTCVTAALHIRAGHPDFGRVPLYGEEHMKHLREYNEKLAKQNKIICSVYISGDHLDQTIFAQYISEEMPKNNSLQLNEAILWPSTLVSTRVDSFVFKFLPHFVLGSGEIEFQVKTIKEQGKITMEDLYLEFVTDVKVLSAADIFFGSWSNIFIVVDALRNAYRPELPHNSTCFIQSSRWDKKLECRGGGDVLKIWRDLFGGFSGAQMYFPEQ